MCVCVYIYIYMCVYMYVYVYIYIYLVLLSVYAVFQREEACYVLECSIPKRYLYDSAYVRGKGKGKAIPVQA
jgi:hypothetical protein